MKTAKRLLRKPDFVIGFGIILFFVTIAILAPWLAPASPNHDPYETVRDGFSNTPRSPSRAHPFGTTQGQYDLYYAIVWGTRVAFRVGLTVTSSIAAIGLIIGTLAAYYGGLFDEIVMRVVDIFLSFPFLIAAMTLAAVLGRSLTHVMLALIVFGWMNYARLMRSEVLATKERGYVESARALGGGTLWILSRHIIPNSLYSVMVRFTMDIGTMVIWAAALSFLGVGVEVGYADWGQMLSLARNWIVGPPSDPFKYWYTVVYPGGALILFSLGWNLIGDAFRDVFDPKMRTQ